MTSTAIYVQGNSIANQIKFVIVKNMGRFGRYYLHMGMYTDILFPEFGVHFITVNDCVDGLGPAQIAKCLKQNQILNPTAYAHSKGPATSLLSVRNLSQKP